MSEWISVKDRLPGEKQRVIVRCSTIGTTVGWILWGEWMTDLGRGCSNVTHWMPLPEPPAESGEAGNECPTFVKCTVTYRGSACAALRGTYGIDSDPEIITNADRIRAMSDEELVAFLDDLTCLCVDCNEHEGENENCPIYNKGCGRYCEPKDFMNWLRQPAEED